MHGTVTFVGYIALFIASVAALVVTGVLLVGHILLKPAKDAWYGKRYQSAQ